MAILRTGPWRTTTGVISTSENKNPATDFSSYVSKAPVNCAFDNWSNQDWGAVLNATSLDSSTGNESFMQGGLYGLGDGISVTGDGFENFIDVGFYWQSTVDATIEVDWSISGTDSFYWSYDYITIGGSSYSDNGNANNGNTEIFTLPATTLGFMNISGVLSASNDTLTITINEF